jgi:hypothetical protein
VDNLVVGGKILGLLVNRSNDATDNGKDLILRERCRHGCIPRAGMLSAANDPGRKGKFEHLGCLGERPESLNPYDELLLRLLPVREFLLPVGNICVTEVIDGLHQSQEWVVVL